MKKHFILSLFFLSGIFFLIASPQDSISTIYQNGEFVTHCQVYVSASDSISNAVLNDFDYQMRYKLDALFGWALKGMNLRKEKDELMIFYFKSTSYNKETNVIKCVGDIIVPGYITSPDINIESRISSQKFSNGKSSFYIDLLNSNRFIKKMSSNFSVIPKKDKGVWFTLDTQVRFNWFFNIFITQKRFKSIMEWRLKRFVHNIKDEAERREKRERPRSLMREIRNMEIQKKIIK